MESLAGCVFPRIKNVAISTAMLKYIFGKSRYVRCDICWPFENFRNEKDMTQRQLEATDLTSQPAGARKLCPGKIIDLIILKAKKTRLF